MGYSSAHGSTAADSQTPEQAGKSRDLYTYLRQISAGREGGRDNELMKKTELLAYAFFGAIGMAVVGVIGSIAINAFRNQGFIPPPGTLSRYECRLADTPFEFFYLHGTERVKLKSRVGILEGTVSQNQFNWGSFANDATQLGFMPPAAITFEDAKGLRMGGGGLSAEMVCSNTAAPDSGRRGIVQ